MSYPDILDTSESISSLLSKKEFAQLSVKPVSEVLNPIFLDKLLADEGRLFLHPQQQFVRNFMSPNTSRKRLLAKHDTGTGKTNMAIIDAFEFIKYYKRQFEFTKIPDESPLVFVIGFTKYIFQRELLRRPEFGFVTSEEIKELRRLKYLADVGSVHDKDVHADFEAKLKKRLTKKSFGGFFKFIGYKEFFNRLFIFANLDQMTQSVSDLTEELLMEEIQKKNVTINYDLVDAFANSFVICDEIHNVYNSIETNNYGLALRVILNIFDIPDMMHKIVNLEGTTRFGKNRLDLIKNSNLRILFLSATPINNSPTEIIDLLNLLIPQSELPNQKKLEKNDFFIDNRNLKKGALEIIQNITKGYISFFRNQDPKYFPQRVFEGDYIKIPKKLHNERTHGYDKDIIPYLKFTRCEMSKLHYDTYQAVYEGTLPPDGQSLVDLVLPRPPVDHSADHNTTSDLPGAQSSDKLTGKSLVPPGIFRSKDVQFTLQHAPQEWKDKYQIELVKGQGASIITGEFMRMPTLKLYSTKYAKMIELLIDNLQNDRGKVLIIHQNVKMSGVLFIQETLLRNGFIFENSSATDDTLCVICGIRLKNHNFGKKARHEFVPAKFSIYYGEMDQLSKSKTIERFNSPENVDGNLCRILIGSKATNEAIDLVAVQNIWVMNAPANIPTLLQILGRVIRNKSHLQLPVEKRQAFVRIFTSSVPGANELSYEEYKYFEKSMDYLVIQRIEKIFNSVAIDAPLYRSVIFPEHEQKAELGTLYFDMLPIFGKKWIDIANGKTTLALKDVDTSTFTPYYSLEEINLLIYIIKRLFIEQSQVWKYDDLLIATRDPPFEVYVNSSLFQEENFMIALNSLCFSKDRSKIAPSVVSSQISMLFDPLVTKIIHGGMECVIFPTYTTKKSTGGSGGKSVGPGKLHYLILVPTKEIIGEDDYSIRSLGTDGSLIVGNPVLDIDSWNRREQVSFITKIRLTESLKTSNISYYQMKYRFYEQFVDTPIDKIPTTVELYDLDFHIHLVEDAIRYVFNLYTNANMQFSELHSFYFKILYFYDRLNMVLFADQIKDTKIYGLYSQFIETKKKIPFKVQDQQKYLEAQNGYDAFLISSISKSESGPKFDINRLNNFLGKRQSSSSKKIVRIEDMKFDSAGLGVKKNKIYAELLPIGHFLITSMESGSAHHASIPKIYLYENEGVKDASLWKRAPEFIAQFSRKNEVENDILIGYYEKNLTGINVKFKLRPPIHKIEQYDDSRMIERGSACNTRHKEDLVEIAKSLGIKTNTQSIKDICNLIKLNLMKREMSEREKWKRRKTEKRTRWFYLHFEPQFLL